MSSALLPPSPSEMRWWTVLLVDLDHGDLGLMLMPGSGEAAAEFATVLETWAPQVKL